MFAYRLPQTVSWQKRWRSPRSFLGSWFLLGGYIWKESSAEALFYSLAGSSLGLFTVSYFTSFVLLEDTFHGQEHLDKCRSNRMCFWRFSGRTRVLREWLTLASWSPRGSTSTWDALFRWCMPWLSRQKALNSAAVLLVLERFLSPFRFWPSFSSAAGTFRPHSV